MKKLEGRTLAAHLRECGALPGDELLSLMRQLCAGLDFIHARGFIHRDIKSGNIFIGPDGLATILDFGILRSSENEEALTRTGMVMGTPQYMSPEQAMGAKEIDHRADLYALAILLFECLAGTLPFEAESELSLIQMQAHAPAPDVIDRAPWVPRLVSDVVKRALAKRPEERYGSAGELVAALEDAYLGKLPAPVTERPREQEGAVPGAPESGETFTKPSLRRFSGRFTGPPAPSVMPSWARGPASTGAGVATNTSELARFAKKSRMPLYIATAVGIALLALGTAFVRTRAATPSTQVSAPRESPPTAVARAPTEYVGGGLGLALVQPPSESASRDLGPAGEANESKTRPVRRQASLHRSGSHLVGSLNVITTLRGEPYWASVLIDGVHRGNTPLNVELSPGKHRIHLERAGFRSVDRQIKIASGRPGVLRVELVP
jgi:serine/threonine-protein kinase